ncbi:hexose phosphate transporter [Mycoplasmopsis cricetuli]|uniref:hexose phosphate transporter n=1 Tax=Mycoplasmopsis cricetuli TaxID=171283 RepID=UPI00046F9FCD|nr:hexose phosphate transporter [Mycoplasmopsis cricetuli]
MINFLKPNNIKEKPLKITHGFILWGLLVFGYFLFVINWLFASQLSGEPGNTGFGILKHFFPNADDAPGSITNQAVNWVITIGRAIGSVLIGWLIVKVSHKWAAVIALGLMVLSLPGPYLGNYWAFIVFRTFLGIGGTTLIVLIQPIISAFFPPRIKSSISQFSPWFYPLGVIVVVAPFVGKVEILKEISDKWQTVFLIINLLTLIPLIGFILFGSRFDIYPSVIKKQEEQALNNPQTKVSISTLLKQKETWFWAILYISWLIAVVIPYVGRNWIFSTIAQGTTADEITENVKELRKVYTPIISIFFLLFHAGMFLGSFTIGLWSRFRLKRRWFISTILFLGVLFYALSLVVFRYMVYPSNELTPKTGNNTWLFYILGFLMGLCLWGIQGVMLNLPHEYKGSNPKQVGYKFGLIWGLGYAGWTIALIILSMFNQYVSSSAAIALLVIFSLISVVAIFLLKEPNPEYDTFPNRNTQQIKK